MTLGGGWTHDAWQAPPEDAWTGFLRERDGMVSTREGARPFSADEQWRILRQLSHARDHLHGRGSPA